MATIYVTTTGNDSTGNGTSGNPYLTIGKALTVASSADTIAVKTGTYTITSALVVTQATLTIQGFQTTAGDGGTKPLITTATNSTNIFSTSSNSGAQLFDNLSLSNTAGTRGHGIVQLSVHGTAQYWIWRNCVLDGFVIGINSDNGVGDDVSNIIVQGTEIKNCSSAAIWSNVGRVFLSGCYLHDNTTFDVTANTAQFIATRSIFTNSSVGVSTGGAGVNYVENCVFYGISGDAFTPAGSGFLSIKNTVFYGNGRAIATSGVTPLASQVNAYGNNTSASTGWGTSPGDITLTANPFTNAAGGDFSLNATAGGGALLKASGYYMAFTNPALLDVGAVQSGSGGGGGGGLLTLTGMTGGIRG